MVMYGLNSSDGRAGASTHFYKGSWVQIHVREGFFKIENQFLKMNPGQDLNYHAETHLSDIL